MTVLYGRVFSRLQQYEALPVDFKDQVRALEQHLIDTQNEVFEAHFPNVVNLAHGVRYKRLLEKVSEYLDGKMAPHAASAPNATTYPNVHNELFPPASGDTEKSQTQTNDVPFMKDKARKNNEGFMAKAKAMAEAALTKPTAAQVTGDRPRSPSSGDAPSIKERAAMAKDVLAFKMKAVGEAARGDPKPMQETHFNAQAPRLIEALVFKGFITPYKEDWWLANLQESISFKDNDLFVPVNKAVRTPARPITTVWDLVDGAVFAGTVKRKAGVLVSITHGTNVYAVINHRLKSLTLFESDVGREPVLQIEAGIHATNVANDKSHFEHGIKVWNETVTELFNASSVNEREAFLEALRSIGMRFQEELVPDLWKVQEPTTLGPPPNSFEPTKPGEQTAPGMASSKYNSNYPTQQQEAHQQTHTTSHPNQSYTQQAGNHGHGMDFDLFGQQVQPTPAPRRDMYFEPASATTSQSQPVDEHSKTVSPMSHHVLQSENRSNGAYPSIP